MLRHTFKKTKERARSTKRHESKMEKQDKIQGKRKVHKRKYRHIIQHEYSNCVPQYIKEK